MVATLANFEVNSSRVFIPRPEAWRKSQSLSVVQEQHDLDSSSPEDDEHPLLLAIRYSQQNVIEFFLRCNGYRTLLGCFQELCARPSSHSLRNLELLLARGSSLGTPIDINAVDTQRNHPIQVALLNSHWHMVKWLLSNAQLCCPDAILADAMIHMIPPQLLFQHLPVLGADLGRYLSWESRSTGDKFAHVLVRYLAKNSSNQELMAWGVPLLCESFGKQLKSPNAMKLCPWHLVVQAGLVNLFEQLESQIPIEDVIKDYYSQEISPVVLAAQEAHQAC